MDAEIKSWSDTHGVDVVIEGGTATEKALLVALADHRRVSARLLPDGRLELSFYPDGKITD